jgi:hypothetical protein
MIQLQNNDLSIPARQLVPLLRDLDVAKPATEQAAHRLLRWNDVLDRDSPEAAIYEMWQRHMLADIRTVFVPREARDYIGNPEMSKVIAWLTAPDGRFGADPVAGRNAFLEKNLDGALDHLTRFSRGVMKHDGVFVLRRNPHPAARSLLLEVNFIESPEVYRLVSHVSWEFFYAVFVGPGRPWPKPAAACAAESPIDGTVAGTGAQVDAILFFDPCG